MTRHPWAPPDNAALFTDLYQLTMLQAYFKEGMSEPAVFDLFARRLPDERNYLLAAGLDDCLRFLETLRFTPEAIDYLKSQKKFHDDFLDYLRSFRFTGDVYAIAEGTPVFANEPIVEVVALIAEAQLVESYLLNQIHFQTVAASKTARVVRAGAGRAVVDFGMRRMHGADAAMKFARAGWIAGLAATSNVLAGQIYGIPISGTMAHSYIEAHDNEIDALRAFARLYPTTALLVDTYDTLEGVRRVVELAREMGDDFKVRAIRLDSGDLIELAKASRRILDEGGLENVEIIASSSLDEHKIAEIVERDAPISGFGVGTKMGVSADAPYLDSAYKLVGYAGRGRMKLSKNKKTWPGRKQVFRRTENGRAAGDALALHDETLEGRPLLRQVMRNGERLDAGRESLEAMRERARAELDALPPELHRLEPADPPYRVEVSDRLASLSEQVRREIEKQAEAAPISQP